jgi:hypothetical protein
MRDPNVSEYVSYDDVERYFGISRRTLQYWIQARSIDPVPDREDNRRRLLRRADVEVLAQTYARDICQILERTYGPFDPLTCQVLAAAESEAQGLPIRGLHLMLAAFSQTWPGLPSPETPYLNPFVTDSAVRGSYEAVILRKLLRQQTQQGSRRPPLFGADAISGELANTLSICAESVRPHPMTVAALIRAVLQNDQDVIAVFAEVPVTARLPREQLLRELEQAIPMTFQQPVDSLATKIEPSKDHRYAHRHAKTIDGILNRLAFRDVGEFVVCFGLMGSPISRLHKILADVIARGDFLAYRAQLGGYKSLFSLDISALRMFSEAEAEQKLIVEMQRAASGGSILLLRRFEALNPVEGVHRAVDNALVRTLVTRIGSAAVIAIYEQSSERDPDPSDRFPDLYLPMLLVPAGEYNTQQTLAIIKRDYEEEWKQNDQIEMAAGALDSVFALEAATFEKGRRKTLPYLAIDLAGQAIATMRAGKSGASLNLAHTVFLDAARSLSGMLSHDGAVRILEREISSYANHENDAVRELAQAWSNRIHELEMAQQDIEDFLANPSTPMRDQYELLTRSMINAQFFGTGRYEFRLRNIFQWRLEALLKSK